MRGWHLPYVSLLAAGLWLADGWLAAGDWRMVPQLGSAPLVGSAMAHAMQDDGSGLRVAGGSRSDSGTAGEATAGTVEPGTSGPVETFEPGQTLAIVGGHPIFVSDMTAEVNQLLDQFLGAAPPEVRDAQRPMLIRRLLPKYISSKLMYVDVIASLPAEANLDAIFEAAGEQFDENVLPMLLEQAGLNSPAELDTYLRAQGSSLRMMRRSWSENELVKYLTREKIDVDPEITHQELLDYYRRNRSDFEVRAKVRWEQIMVRFDRFPTRQAARNEIAKLGNEVVYGAPLAAVAQRGSHGLRAEQGGLHDWTEQGSLVSRELDAALFELPIDHLSDIIESHVGYHIVRVLERREAGFIPFTEAQTDIRRRLSDQKLEQAFQDHLEHLRSTIPVEILIDGPMDEPFDR